MLTKIRIDTIKVSIIHNNFTTYTKKYNKYSKKYSLTRQPNLKCSKIWSHFKNTIMNSTPYKPTNQKSNTNNNYKNYQHSYNTK
jgi:hypothetical protein